MRNWVETITTASISSAASVLSTQLLTGAVSWPFAIVVFLVAALGAWFYLRADTYPLGTYRVTGRDRDGKTLVVRSKDSGKAVGEAWQFLCSGPVTYVYGPYLSEPLRKGKYRATFRLKIRNIQDADHPVVDIDVISNGQKMLGRKTVSNYDFVKADTFRDFILDIVTERDAPEVELRVTSSGCGDEVTLDFVHLGRRIL